MKSVIGAYFSTPRVRNAALFYGIISGILTQIPLFNYLGYEFSAVMSIPAAFISGIITIQFLKEHRQKPLTRRTWLHVVIDYIHVNFLLLLIPFIVISLNALAVKNCAYTKGIAFYVTIPLITMVFSVSLALVVGTIFRHSATVFSLILLVILSHILAVTYFEPQLFAYNIILGFFPGITYDETVGDIKKLLLFREWTILVSLSLIILFFIINSSWKNSDSKAANARAVRTSFPKDRLLWIYFLICLALAGTGWIFRSEYGFEYSSSDIQKELGRRSESDHFIFYYSSRDYTIGDIIRLRAEAEFDYEIVCRKLAILEKNKKKIEVFVYSSGSEKQKFIGTSNTNITKPWNREIHLTSSSFESAFRHELVHVLAGNFGFPIICASIRMGLNEGLAVATDWDEGMFSPHHYAAALLRENALQNPSTLFSLSGFASQSSSYAYLVSGSFCKYLIDRFGVNRFKFAFSNGNFVLAFGETIDDLIGEWTAFLKTVDTSGVPPETVRALFFQNSIFYKTCAREVADKNLHAIIALRVKDYAAAEREFEASYSDAPTALALRGLFSVSLIRGKYRQVIDRFNQLPQQSLFRDMPALLLLAADANYLLKNERNAIITYQSIAQMNYSESFTEAAVLREELINEGVSPVEFHTIYYDGLSDSAIVEFVTGVKSARVHSPALTYLAGTVMRRMGNDSSALMLFQEYSRISLIPVMRYCALKQIGDIHFQSGRYESAKIAYWSAKNFALTEALNSKLDERIDLCESIILQIQ